VALVVVSRRPVVLRDRAREVVELARDELVRPRDAGAALHRKRANFEKIIIAIPDFRMVMLLI